MMSWKKTKIGKFLFEREGRFKPNDKSLLNLNRLEKIDFSGNFHIGQKASRTDMILIKRGDFVISGINVSKGAMGIYRESSDITATIHYSSYTFDESKIDINYFEHFLQSAEFVRLLEDQVKGGIKTEIKAKHLLNLEIYLPSLDQQKKIAEKLKHNEEKQKLLKQEINNQKIYLKNLRKQILQDAIVGKLTKEWREKNPDIEPASELLKKIKKEKEKLISEKKIKKEKTLPPIEKNEVPFELPSSWIWTRIGEITNYGSSEKIEPNRINDDTWVLDLEDIEKESSKIINFETFKNRNTTSSKSVFKKGDVLYSKLRPYLDKVVVAPGDGICTTEIIPIKMFAELNPLFFMYSLKRRDFLDYASRCVKGMKMPRFGTEDVKLSYFPLPPQIGRASCRERVCIGG
jgi:type I restriction enzyme S subunit